MSGAMRQRGFFVAIAMALLSVGMLAVLAPAASEIAEPALLVALAGIAGVAYSLKVWLEADSDDAAGGTTFDATVVVALVALYLGGEWAAVAVWLVPDVLHRCVYRRAPVLTRGLALNIASFALAALAGAALIGSTGGAAAGLFLAGVVMVQVNFLVAPLLYATLFEGREDRRLLLTEHAALTPITLLMLAIGVATAVLVDQHGLAGLGLLSVPVILPEVRWRRIAPNLPALAPRLADPAERLERDAAATEALMAAVMSQLDALVETPGGRGDRPRPAPGPGARRRRPRGDQG